MKQKLLLSIAFMTMLLLSASAHAAELVNLNKANAAAIQQNLVGIGPIKAEAIVSYRKKNGRFKSIDDLQNVKGLGPALIKKNKRYLSLSKGVVSGDDKAYAASKKKAKASKSAKKTTKTKKSTKTKSTSKKSAKSSKSTSKSKTSKSTTKDKKTTKPKKKKDKKKNASTT